MSQPKSPESSVDLNEEQDNLTQQKRGQDTGSDTRPKEEIERDNALAERLSSIIEHANEQVVPLCDMIRKVSRCLTPQKSMLLKVFA